MFRSLALVGLIATLAISASFRYRARQGGSVIRRAEERAGLKAGRLAVGLPLFASVLLVFVRPQWLSWADIGLPPWLRAGGAAMTLAAVPAAWWVFRSIGRNVSETVLTKGDHELVTVGPYRWIRHPLYTTGSLLLVGVGLATANAFVLGMALIASLAVQLYVVPIEERELRARFGEAYVQYARSTGRVLPRLRTRKAGGDPPFTAAT